MKFFLCLGASSVILGAFLISNQRIQRNYCMPIAALHQGTISVPVDVLSQKDTIATVRLQCSGETTDIIVDPETGLAASGRAELTVTPDGLKLQRFFPYKAKSQFLGVVEEVMIVGGMDYVRINGEPIKSQIKRWDIKVGDRVWGNDEQGAVWIER